MNLKKILKKSLISFLAIALLYSNCYLCTWGVLEVIAQETVIPGIEIELENTQYVQFKQEIEKEEEATEDEVDYNAGVAVKTKMQLGINEEENLLPIKSTEISISLPVLNGYLPVRANIVLANTKLSTGEINNKKINQNYDSNSGLLNVSYQNDEAYSNYNKDLKDEFEIIYIYSKEAYTGNDEEILMQYSINSKMTFETESEELVSEKTEGIELKEKDNKGNLVEFGITEYENLIYKGFMYSNVQNGTEYETEYNTTTTLNVLNSDMINDLTMTIKENRFVLNDEEKTEVFTEGKTIYKSTKITKEEFDKILGENGCLEIYNNEELLSIVKYIEITENDEIVKRLAVIYSEEDIKILTPEDTTIVVEYGKDISSLIIKSTKPIAEGYMKLQHQNAVKASREYVVNVEDIKSIKVESLVNEIKRTAELLLFEPKIKISAILSNVNFSTLQNNKTTLTINLDSTKADTKLFNNPVIKVKLPDGLVGGKLSSPEIVNGNGLTIKNASAKDNVIAIELKGNQKEYDITNVSGGASIVMDIDNIDFDDTTPTHTDSVVVTCIQENEQVKVKQDVNIISKSGILMLSTLTGFDKENTKLTSIDSKLKTVTVDVEEAQKELVQNIDFVNNYDENVTNVEIIGRLGYNEENLNSNFDLTLTKPIELEDAKVYYSTNKDANYNDDTWSEEFIAEAKSYKVEIHNKELLSKDKFSMKVYMNLPANLYYNKKSYVKTEINYINNERHLVENSKFGIITESNDLSNNTVDYSAILENENGNAIPVNVVVTPNVKQNYVHSRQIVTYNIKITNNGTEELKNIKLEDIIPDNAIYTFFEERQTEAAISKFMLTDAENKNIVWNIKTLKPGQWAECEVMLTMKDVEEEQDIINKARLTYNEQIIEAESKLILKPAKIETVIEMSSDDMVDVKYDADDITEYYLKVKNISKEKLKNIKVKFEIPENLEYIEGGLAIFDEFEGYQIQKDTIQELVDNKFEYTIDKLKASDEITLAVKVKIKELENSLEEKIVAISQVEIGEEIYESNIKTIKTEQSSLKTSLTCDVNNKTILKKDDEVIFSLNVENIGLINTNVNIKDSLPEGIEMLKLEEYINGEQKVVDTMLGEDIDWITNLDKGEKLTLKLYTKVSEIKVEEIKDINVINKAIVTFRNKDLVSNEIELIIRPELLIEEVDTEDEYYVKAYSTEDLHDIKYNVEDDVADNEDEEYMKSEEKNDTDKENSGDKVTSNGNKEETKKEENKKEENKKEESNKKEEDKNNANNTNKPNDSKEQNPTNQETTNSNTNNNGDENKKVDTYSISGSAWLDLDKNGERTEKENIKSDIRVSLVNMVIGNFATDANGNRIITQIDDKGRYEFKDIPKGLYAIMYEFDTDNYTVTTYKKEKVDTDKNSDAILTNVTIDGQEKVVGITDKFELNSNIENVNIGLIEKAVFDLSLNKQITEITVVDKKETNTYEYKNGHTAKVDLNSKYMDGANVIIKYKFTITNNGEVTGYVDSLFDTLPEGLEFSSELNSDWYKDSDGNLYTSALSGIAIKPGQSEDIELVLTKTMTEENAGTFPNNARLEKISNLENIKEKEDAIEDNESSAILIISIKTGSILLYMGVTILCIAILGIGVYFIKKKVLITKI